MRDRATLVAIRALVGLTAGAGEPAAAVEHLHIATALAPSASAIALS